MRTISVEKVTLNIGVGEPGLNLDRAVKLLNNISGEKPTKTKAKKRIPTWKIRPGLEIGAKVTLRGNKAKELLKLLLKAKANKLSRKCFDNWGNFSFGITEYLDIPDIKYDAEIGIIGLEVMVTLQRPGFRVKRRSRRKSKISAKHKISKEEAVEFMKKEFRIEVED
jgi:large subunit ribosomal protein L5